MSRYVAAYDIGRTSRRTRVAKLLARYGRRVQRSVFEIEIDAGDLVELRFRIGLLLSEDDYFDLFPIDCRYPKRRISWQRDPTLEARVIVI